VEWVVVDNASTDDSVAVAQRCGADVVVRLPENRGFSAANNVGTSVAAGDNILFANPDLTVDFEGLAALQRRLDEGVGLVAPQLLNEDGTRQPNGRGFPTLLNKVRNRTPGRELSDYRIFAAPGETVPVCFAIGAAVAGTRAFIESLGGWDEGYFVYYEDSDLGLRSWMAGGPVELIGDVRWRHEWARATLRPRLQPWVLEARSMTRFYGTYPALLGSQRSAERRFPEIAARLSSRR
jgi:GT2 family glycosyltransferase